MRPLIMLCAALLLASCSISPRIQIGGGRTSSSTLVSSNLFPQDRLLLPAGAIEEIGSTKISITTPARLAIVDLGSAPGENAALVTMARELSATQSVSSASIVPEMMIPAEVSIGDLRSIGARFKADYVVVLQPTLRTMTKSGMFSSTIHRTESTVNALLLDPETGIIVFSGSATSNNTGRRTRDDFSTADASERIQREALGSTTAEVAAQVASFLASATEI